MTDITYYGDYRLIRDRMGNWYCECFEECFDTLPKIKKFIDNIKKK